MLFCSSAANSVFGGQAFHCDSTGISGPSWEKSKGFCVLDFDEK